MSPKHFSQGAVAAPERVLAFRPLELVAMDFTVLEPSSDSVVQCLCELYGTRHGNSRTTPCHAQGNGSVSILIEHYMIYCTPYTRSIRGVPL